MPVGSTIAHSVAVRQNLKHHQSTVGFRRAFRVKLDVTSVVENLGGVQRLTFFLAHEHQLEGSLFSTKQEPPNVSLFDILRQFYVANLVRRVLLTLLLRQLSPTTATGPFWTKNESLLAILSASKAKEGSFMSWIRMSRTRGGGGRRLG